MEEEDFLLSDPSDLVQGEGGVATMAMAMGVVPVPALPPDEDEDEDEEGNPSLMAATNVIVDDSPLQNQMQKNKECEC